MPYLHYDEAKRAAIDATLAWLVHHPDTRVLLIADLLGKLRLAIWHGGDIEVADLGARLSLMCGAWWTGEALHVTGLVDAVRQVYEGAWEQGHGAGPDGRLRVMLRHRTRTAWFSNSPEPLWPVAEGRPPVLVFYSFKGGLGRSTTLAAFAMQRAATGERVCVLDYDLDSPGIGSLLSADNAGLTAPWGVVDALLEQTIPGAPLDDYYHRCDRVSGRGEIVVFPAGQLDADYADKLARLDLEETPHSTPTGLKDLFGRIRGELLPHWVLVDARTGYSESAGHLLGGLAHLHVLLGTTQQQSWQGINMVLERLGKQRILDDRLQADVLMVHAMVPPAEAGKLHRDEYAVRSEREFTDRYYAPASEEADNDYWTLSDLDSQDAPHVPVAIDYDARVAAFGDIAEVQDVLCAGPYLAMGERIMGRFAAEATS